MTTSIRQWSDSAAGNNGTVAGINFAEGQLPSTVNNSARELMAQVRQWYYPDEAGWVDWGATASVASQTLVKLAGDQTAMCMAGRRVRLRGGSVAARYASIVSASFTTETSVTLGNADGSLSASMSIAGLAATSPNTLPSRFAGPLEVSATLSAANATFGGSVKVSATLSAAAAQIATTGSAAAPALAKSDDTDTGLYWPAANELGLAVGGNDVVRLKWDGLNNSTLVAFGTSANSSARVLIVDNIGNYPPLEVHAFSNSTGVVAFRHRAAGFSGTAMTIDVSATASNSFNFLRMHSTANSDVEFAFRGDGTALADGSFAGGGADFAEMREWADGNCTISDRVGITVTLTHDGKIRRALAGEDPIGAISAKPTIVGGLHLNWPRKYKVDDFGRGLRDEQGRFLANEQFDSSRIYKGRDHRSEWAAVGLLGFIPIRNDQVTSPRWIRSRRVSDAVTEWLVR